MPGDPLAGLTGFTRALREAGVGGDRHRVATYLDAVRLLDLVDPAQVYWAGRLTLCADPDDLPRYDQAFARWFGALPAATRTQPVRQTARMAALGADSGADHDRAEGETEPLAAAASETEILRHRDLGALTAAERAHLRQLFATLRPAPPLRRSVRTRPARTGRLDPARTLRAMLAAGGEPVRLARKRRTTRPRRVVFLLDVSGSMRPYVDALLRFTHVVSRHSPGGVEVFTLGTRLTRVTRQLRQRDPDRALLAAGGAVPDFAGGTRLGETLKAFADRWGRRGVARGAVLVICSDGWERGDPALLAEQVAGLRRIAHAVLWVNPHAGKPGYQPRQAGIIAVLPHIDLLLAGHTIATLQQLLEAIEGLVRVREK